MSLATQIEVPRAAGAGHFAAAEGGHGRTAVDLVPVAVGDGRQLLGQSLVLAPSGKLTVSYGKSPSLGKSAINGHFQYCYPIDVLKPIDTPATRAIRTIKPGAIIPEIGLQLTYNWFRECII